MPSTRFAASGPVGPRLGWLAAGEAWPALGADADPAASLAGFFASEAWFRTLAAHALPADVTPRFARLEAAGRTMLLPLVERGGRFAGLTTVYSCRHTPAIGAGGDPAALHEAGRELAELARLRAPLRLDALEDGLPLDALLGGVRAAGLRVRRFAHFGNWHADVAGLSWPAYLAGRPGALRETVRRRLARADRDPSVAFACVDGPDGLEAGIAAYEAVYARSWKEPEPYPAFNAALMREAAPLGVLRLGVLRVAGQPVAAQLWIVAGGAASVLKLAHDEAHRALSPGTVLTARMAARLLDRERVSELDFGRGDDSYKQLWATARRARIGVLIVDPRHPAGLAALLRHEAGRVRRRLRGSGG